MTEVEFFAWMLIADVWWLVVMWVALYWLAVGIIAVAVHRSVSPGEPQLIYQDWGCLMSELRDALRDVLRKGYSDPDYTTGYPPDSLADYLAPILERALNRNYCASHIAGIAATIRKGDQPPDDRP